MSLDLEIIVPDGVVVHARVTSVQAADASGRFGLRTGHERFLTLVSPCVVAFTNEAGQECIAAADGGVLVLEADHVSLATREAIVADRLEDVADAAAAMLTARRAQEEAARVEFAELRSTLVRELRRVEKRS